jgi:WD40 repeat protein
MRMFSDAGELGALAFAPSGALLVAVANGASVGVWDRSAQRRLQELTGSGRTVRCVALSGDGQWVAAGSDDGVVGCWKVANGRLVDAYTQPGRVTAIAMSPDGRCIASAGPRASVHIWRSGRLLGRLAVGKGVACLAFAPDGSRLVVGSTSGWVTMWDVATCQLADEIAALNAPLESLSISPDGQHLAATGNDGSIWMRRLPTQAAHTRPRLLPTGNSVIESSYRLFDWLRRAALL